MNKHISLSFTYLIYLSFVCLSILFADKSKLPNDVRWVVKSNEYKKLCEQIYERAEKDLPYLYNKNDNQVIVMDLDETVLDNSQYQVELFNNDETFNMDSWSKWVLKAEADLVPGSLDFSKLVRFMDIQIIFISNRMDKRVKATKKNLKKLGIYSDKDIYLLRQDKKDKKNIRRDEIYSGTWRMKKYGAKQVIAYFGDAIGDFPDNLDKGVHYIFPNPMYGKW